MVLYLKIGEEAIDMNPKLFPEGISVESKAWSKIVSKHKVVL